MTNPKFWLVSAIDDDPVQCQSFNSTVDLAVATRELVEGNESRHVYAFCFYGDRLSITKGPERYIVVPHHTPSHYALFGRSGEITDVDDKDGQLCAGPCSGPDVGYQKLTEVPDDDVDDGALTEPEEIAEEH